MAPRLWSRGLDWALSRGVTMSMLGVPYPQHEEVRRQHAQGVPGFVREAVGYVCRQIPIWTNYFWRLYVEGGFDRQCCPEYLKRDNFHALKGGLVDRISIHTATVTQFLNGTDESISRFVLLDHMDWMSSFYPLALSEEWEALLAVDNALAMLKPGGKLGVVDFTVSPARNGLLARWFWQRWFAHDGVRLDAAHLPHLAGTASEITRREALASVPYLPGLRVPYYLYVGRKRWPAEVVSAREQPTRSGP